MTSPYATLRELAGAATVLVVDDEPAIRSLIAVTLELEGHVVLQAADGRQALEVARSTSLSLITLDVMMPGLSGWDVADALKVDPRTAHVPRLMVSGKPLTELHADNHEGKRADAVLGKPFDLVQFLETVNALLDAASGRAQQALPALPRQQRRPAPTTAPPSALVSAVERPRA